MAQDEYVVNKRKVIIILIFLIGFIARFYRLGDVPVGFHRDEAFLGYNAYSILKTGKDINGNIFPLHLESFIYSPAGYSYFSIPPIYLFGLNPFSVRFSSAFFGSLTVVLTFFLVRKLFEEDRFYNLAIFSSLFLGLSPWHINLSRTSTENTLVVFFITLGVYLFLEFLNKKRIFFLILSFLSFGLTLLIYQAPRAFLPFFIPLLVISFLPKNFKTRIYIFCLYLIVIIIPLFLILLSPNLSSRIRSLNIFSNPQTQLTIDENLREDGISNVTNNVSRILHNKLTGYSSLIFQNYFKHFSYDFLFTENSLPDRYRIPQMGLLYIFELPLMILGLLYLLKDVKKKKIALFFIGWILFAPIGSSLTFDDVPNLQRTLIIFPALSIISALGLFYFISLINKTKYFNSIILVLSLIFLYSVSFYFHQYYVNGIVHRPWYRDEGYKSLVEKVNSLSSNYKKAVITNRETAPTIFFLFFGKYDPYRFQTETKGQFGSQSDSVNFNKYVFTDKECPLRILNLDETTNEKLFNTSNTGDRGILYVNSGNCKSPKIPVDLLYTVRRSDESVVFRIYDVK